MDCACVRACVRACVAHLLSCSDYGHWLLPQEKSVGGSPETWRVPFLHLSLFPPHPDPALVRRYLCTWVRYFVSPPFPSCSSLMPTHRLPRPPGRLAARKPAKPASPVFFLCRCGGGESKGMCLLVCLFVCLLGFGWVGAAKVALHGSLCVCVCRHT